MYKLFLMDGIYIKEIAWEKMLIMEAKEAFSPIGLVLKPTTLEKKEKKGYTNNGFRWWGVGPRVFHRKICKWKLFFNLLCRFCQILTEILILNFGPAQFLFSFKHLVLESVYIILHFLHFPLYCFTFFFILSFG